MNGMITSAECSLACAWLSNGRFMAKASSRRGQVSASVMISQKTNPGTVFMPFHFAENAANNLTNPALDPISGTPEFKVCAVRIEKSS